MPKQLLSLLISSIRVEGEPKYLKLFIQWATDVHPVITKTLKVKLDNPDKPKAVILEFQKPRDIYTIYAFSKEVTTQFERWMEYTFK